MDIKRFRQVVSYGWKHAGQINEKIKSGESSNIKGRLALFLDILRCFRKYSLWSNQYLKEHFYSLPTTQRDVIGKHYKEANIKKAQWTDFYYKNIRFIDKYSSLKYDYSFKKHCQRNAAYKEWYGFGDGCTVSHHVSFVTSHCEKGLLSVGNNVTFSRNVDIDYTGDVIIGDGVIFSEGCKVITHLHDRWGIYEDDELIPQSNRAVKTPLKIGKGVSMGVRVLIMPKVTEIGENSIISADSVVTHSIPPNVIVAGNPAKVIREFDPEERVFSH